MKLGHVLLMLLAVAGIGSAAELYAKKMSIERLPEGDATVFRDSVVIIDGDTKILSHMARMYDGRGLAVISESVRIMTPDALIWSDSAYYYLNDKRAELFGNVRVRQESLDIEAPYLVYRSGTRLVEADKGVLLSNLERSFRLTGKKGHYDLATDVGTVDALPVLVWQRDNDSARVTGRTMYWYRNESRAVAEGNVRLKSGASEVTCDTVIYLSGPDSGFALGKPEVRDSVSRASGDSMSFVIHDGALEQVTIRNSASGEYRTEGGDQIAVTGQVIHLWMDAGDIERIEVTAMTSGRLTRAGKPAEKEQ